MSETTLSQVLDSAVQTDAGPRFDLPENWAQGRTAYGGFTSALMYAAALRFAPDLPPLRSALINFTAPVTAPVVVRVERLRQGRNVTTLNARAELDGEVAAQGTFSFGAAQDSHVRVSCPAPVGADPAQAEPFFPPEMGRPPVRFAENFDMRLIGGARPFSGAARGYARIWARYREPAMWERPEGLIGIADVMPPAVFPVCRKPGPNSSMTWICNMLADAPETRDGWWMLDTDLTAARNGFSSQVMRVWNRDGDLVAEGMQSVVIFA